jgi:hypothetical protein
MRWSKALDHPISLGFTNDRWAAALLLAQVPAYQQQYPRPIGSSTITIPIFITLDANLGYDEGIEALVTARL